MSIEKRKIYNIKAGIPYFEKKYGPGEHLFAVEDTDVGVFGKTWVEMHGNPACLQFAFRSGMQGHTDFSMAVFYGHMAEPEKPGLGELVWEDELEET